MSGLDRNGPVSSERMLDSGAAWALASHTCDRAQCKIANHKTSLGILDGAGAAVMMLRAWRLGLAAADDLKSRSSHRSCEM